MSRDTDLPPGNLLLELDFAAEVGRLKIVRSSVKSIALAVGFEEDAAMDIVLAVDEAVTNIIRHGYGEEHRGDILLRALQHDDGLAIELHDKAPTADPEKVKPRALEDIKPGKLGTHLIRTIMDRTELLPGPDGTGNLLKLFKKLEKPR